MQQQSSSFSRIDYVQVGLTSKKSFKLIRNSGQNAEVVIGDHSGSVHLFTLRTDSNQIDTVFKTLPGPNAKINCLEMFSGLNMNSSIKILTACGSSTIKGFNKKGKQFFTLELNNLTEPIKMFKICWPDEIYVVGQYIYNSYLINTENIDTNSSSSTHYNLTNNANKAAYNSAVKSRHYYVCPEKINDFVLLEEKFNRKIIPVLACQDRLLRVLKDSTCNFEVEVCGIPSTVQIVPKQLRKQANIGDDGSTKSKNAQQEEVYLCYGTLDGKIAMVTFKFVDKNQLEPLHNWEVPVNAIKQPVNCLSFSEVKAEFYVGRTDGSIEVWKFNESIDADNVQTVDLFNAPSMVDAYSCGESVTNILPVLTNDQTDLILLCSTFTGLVFGLAQHGQAYTQMRQLNPNFVIISKDNATKIETLRDECTKLEKKLESEKHKYEKQTSTQNVIDLPNESNLSILPFFAINDSFVLHNDASYVLMLEVEVAIDVVIMHCNISLDLIDCERNSAVISFNEINEANPHEILATFRCQANTTRLEIRLRPVEGQHGTLSVYVISRITPKSCQTRSYSVQPLSLHKRQYSNTHIDYANSLDITGNFGINDAHNWIRLCIPEVPEKLSFTIPNVESEAFYYVSTMTKSILICNCGKGIISLVSDNVSSISILKDFITREATRQSIQIEIKVEIEDKSLEVMLRNMYPKIRHLILEKQYHDLSEAINDLQSNETDFGSELWQHLNVKNSDKKINETTTENGNPQDVLIGLDRIYGIITDLFIDYHKLKGNSVTNLIMMAKQKLTEMVNLIETDVLNSLEQFQECEPNTTTTNSFDEEPNDASIKDVDLFVEKLYQFWNIQI